MRIAFLHLPKTAGQSVHHSLASLFQESEICPARTNEDLYKYSIHDLSGYKLFSGHLDWSLIKLSGDFDFVFTVLRDPLDRILSFYFYLRKEAERMLALEKPLGEGMKAALYMSAEEYFTGGNQGLRQFLDNHYNNFYSYYFSAGSYCGYSILSKKFPPGSPELVNYALCGLRSLDAVYTMSTLDRLEKDISSLSKQSIKPFIHTNINQDVNALDRPALLSRISDGWDWRPTLNYMTSSDRLIFKKFQN